MHKLFAQELRKFETKKDFLPAIAYQMEHAYHAQNKENTELETTLNKRLSEVKTEMDRLDEKHYIKEELNKEKYDRMMVKLATEEKEIYENLAQCSVSISNLSDKIIEAGELSSKLPSLWASSDLTEQETLQKLVYPSGLGYDKKNQAFRTTRINEAFSQIACLSSDLVKMKKGPNSKKSVKSLLAGSRCQISNSFTSDLEQILTF